MLLLFYVHSVLMQTRQILFFASKEAPRHLTRNWLATVLA